MIEIICFTVFLVGILKFLEIISYCDYDHGDVDTMIQAFQCIGIVIALLLLINQAYFV